MRGAEGGCHIPPESPNQAEEEDQVRPNSGVQFDPKFGPNPSEKTKKKMKNHETSSVRGQIWAPKMASLVQNFEVRAPPNIYVTNVTFMTNVTF